MFNSRSISFAITTFLLCPFWITPTQASTFAPPSGKTLLLVGQDKKTIDAYVQGTGRVPGGVMMYTSIQKMEGLEEQADCGSGCQFGNALLTTYPQSVVQVGLYMVNALGDILDGKYDGNLKKLSRWLKRAKRPVYLRIGYEFDYVKNDYSPAQYKAVFRYIVDFFRREKVTNAAYVWHAYSVLDVNRPWMDWYPGDEYVDWFGVSIFSGGQLYGAERFRALAAEHRKPFMIAESSPMGIYIVRSQVNWLKHLFDFIDQQKVDAWCYINSNWDILPMYKGWSWGDARIEKTPEVKDLWLKETGQDRYLKASKDLFEMLGYTSSIK
ncbi:MAG: hypothetical protein HQL15_08480 [Candidatus Omnitrophica bacterium]|nr:hypothetical protein [Candidatus Omnitrophota bacterium]